MGRGERDEISGARGVARQPKKQQWLSSSTSVTNSSIEATSGIRS
jgi:hypothetical protein